MGRRKTRRSYLIEVDDDGLPSYNVGPWAQDKYRLMGMYAEMFSTGMKNRWETRVYLDLFTGPGYSELRRTGRRYLASPLIALSLPDPFDRYVFCDASAEAIRALRERVNRQWRSADVRYVIGDANDRVNDVIGHIPSAGSVLSFCFLDPYKLNISFDTIRRLAQGRSIDFLILLALYVDANRNLDLYVSEQSEVIDRFIGDPDWRGRWNAARASRKSFVAFLAAEYSARMKSLGYLPMNIKDMVKVRTHERRLPLYYLAFYSKHRRGLDFWRQVREYSADQLDPVGLTALTRQTTQGCRQRASRARRAHAVDDRPRARRRNLRRTCGHAARAVARHTAVARPDVHCRGGIARGRNRRELDPRVAGREYRSALRSPGPSSRRASFESRRRRCP